MKLYHGDCLSVNESDVRLIYTDPPYGSKKEDNYYGIGESFEEYLSYMQVRLAHLKKCLHPDGANILVHVDQKASHYIKIMMDIIFGRENFRNEIVWCYASPSVAKAQMPRKHDNLIWFSVGKNYPFNQPYTPYTGKLALGGKTSWNPDVNTEEYLERGKKLEDYWTDIPSLCRNEKEKLGYATQKPMKLMTRIVESFSNPDDKVYDPFCGSGSLLHAAQLLGRSPVGTDISADAINITAKRLGE